MDLKCEEVEAITVTVSEPQLVSHPRAKSKVWKYFGFDPEDEVGKRAHCRICLAQIGYSGNTTNLYAHLQRHHPDAFIEFEKSTGTGGETTQPPQQLQAPSSSLLPPSALSCSSRQFSHDSKRQLEVASSVLGFLCEGLHPVSVADEPFFQALVRTLDPRVTPPSSAELLSHALPLRHQQVRAAVSAELSGTLSSSCCAVSTDLWTSETHGRSYVTVYAHQLSQTPHPHPAVTATTQTTHPAVVTAPAGFRLVSCCLKTFEVPADGAAEGMTRALYEVFMQWGVASRLQGATTCGSPDLLRACSQLELPVLVPCFAERLNRGVHAAFRVPGVQSLLARCRRLVDYFQQSVVANYMLQERLRQQARQAGSSGSVAGAGSGSASPLVGSGRPRDGGCWSSTLTMLRRLRDNQPAVTAVLLEDANNQALLLGAAEWALLDGLLVVLRALRSAADMFCSGGTSTSGSTSSSSGGPFISMLKPVLHMLLSTALRPLDADSAELRDARRAVASALEEAYQAPPHLDMFLKVASFLDPRYKRLPFLSAGERAQVESRVQEEAAALYQRHAPSQRHGSSSSGHAHLDPRARGCHDDQPPANKKQALSCCATSVDHPDADLEPVDTSDPEHADADVANPLAVIFCQSGAGGAETQEEFQAAAEEELSNFKAQKVLGLNEDPLRWWSDRVLLFPMLPRVLQKYWCVQATSVPAQRLFGPAGATLWGRRNRLDPDLVDQQVFLYENTRNYYGEPTLETSGTRNYYEADIDKDGGYKIAGFQYTTNS
ncbi:dehydrogenase/reductase SDR family member on chromosome X isoform X1 [Engraulis encrasicolus]|uniref:dehydrogenase/reductase SDR family member on chromosome X isoform X1 n=1 Tax=Engraulis encrasicolus TaxID=184585 RepID=UPI002FD52228